MKLLPRLLINWQCDVVTIPSRFVCARRNGTIGREALVAEAMGKKRLKNLAQKWKTQKVREAFSKSSSVATESRVNRALDEKRFSVKDCDIHRLLFLLRLLPSAFHLNLIKNVWNPNRPVISLAHTANFTGWTSYSVCCAETTKKEIGAKWNESQIVLITFGIIFPPNEFLWAIGTHRKHVLHVVGRSINGDSIWDNNNFCVFGRNCFLPSLAFLVFILIFTSPRVVRFNLSLMTDGAWRPLKINAKDFFLLFGVREEENINYSEWAFGFGPRAQERKPNM